MFKVTYFFLFICNGIELHSLSQYNFQSSRALYTLFCQLMDIYQVARTRHFWRHVSVGHVSDTGTGTTRRIPVSGECPLFFFFSFLRHAPTRRRHGSDTAPTRLRRFRHASSEEKKENFGIFRVIPAIPANFGRNENFVRYKILTEKKKSKSYLLLLGFVLFFLLIFFLISVSSSSSSFGFGLLPDYLFFFICVSLLSSTCVQSLDFRVFRLQIFSLFCGVCEPHVILIPSRLFCFVRLNLINIFFFLVFFCAPHVTHNKKRNFQHFDLVTKIRKSIGL